MPSALPLTRRFVEALAYATEVHAGQSRKARYVAHVRTAGPDARRVSCADKLHNARSILRDYRADGERIWTRFNAPPEEQLCYYRMLVDAFRQPDRTALFAELERVVGELEAERRKALEGR